jgi:hypothetical protein
MRLLLIEFSLGILLHQGQFDIIGRFMSHASSARSICHQVRDVYFNYVLQLQVYMCARGPYVTLGSERQPRWLCRVIEVCVRVLSTCIAIIIALQ